MSSIANFNIEIGAITKDFAKGMEGVQKNLKNVGQNVEKTGKTLSKTLTPAIAGVATAFVGLAKKTGDYADRILDLSDITGMSTDSIQEWEAVAAQAGVSTEAMTNASKQLTKQMSALEAGGNRQSAALEKLEINYEDLAAASPDERMNMLTEALAGVEDPALRAQYGTDLLKGAYDDLAPIVAMNADELDNVKKKAHESGAVMSGDALNDANNFRKGLEELKQEFVGMGREIAGEFMPILTDDLAPFIKGTVVPLIKDFADKIISLIDWFKNLSPETQKYIGLAITLAAVLGPVLIVVGKLIAAFSTVVGVLKLVGAGIALLFSPIALKIALIGALIAAGVALYKNWDKVKEFGLKAWNGLLKGLKAIGNGIIAIPNAIIGAFESMVNGIGRAINRIPSIDVPSWVPGIGGSSFGLPKIPTVSLPRVPSLDVGTNFVKRDGLAEIHRGEAVVPKKYNPAAGGYLNKPQEQEKTIVNFEKMFDGANINVNDEDDAVEVARELYRMTTDALRAKGVKMV